MKLRLRGNSIRLRLEQHEIKALISAGEVTTFVSFAPDQKLAYKLVVSGSGKFAASCLNGEMKIEIPLEATKSWADSEEEGIYQTLNTNTVFELKLAIEKDFQCLHKRPNEDESDLYPNPRADN